jgi:hypothetical protein
MSVFPNINKYNYNKYKTPSSNMNINKQFNDCSENLLNKQKPLKIKTVIIDKNQNSSILPSIKSNNSDQIDKSDKSKVNYYYKHNYPDKKYQNLSFKQENRISPIKNFMNAYNSNAKIKTSNNIENKITNMSNIDTYIKSPVKVPKNYKIKVFSKAKKFIEKEKSYIIIIKNKNNPELIREIFSSRSKWIESPVFLSACYTLKWAPSNKFLEYNLLNGNKVSNNNKLLFYIKLFYKDG